MENRNLIKSGAVLFAMFATLFSSTMLKADNPALLSKQELKSLIGSAKSVPDHERLARHYDAKANELEAESKDHQALAAQYKANPTNHESKHPMSAETAGHCQSLADDLHKASERARQMAADHRQMAKQVK